MSTFNNNLRYGELLVICLFGGNDWCIIRKHEMYPLVRHKIAAEVRHKECNNNIVAGKVEMKPFSSLRLKALAVQGTESTLRLGYGYENVQHVETRNKKHGKAQETRNMV